MRAMLRSISRLICLGLVLSISVISLLQAHYEIKTEIHQQHHREHFLREAVGIQVKFCSSVYPYVVAKNAQVVTAKRGFRMLISDKDDVVSNSMRKYLVWEREDTAAIMQAVEYSLSKRHGTSPTFLDIGANLGWYSLVVAHAYPNATIIAFEAMEENAILLRGSICENKGFERKITLINRALGDSTEMCDMVALKTNTQNGIMKCGKDGKPAEYNKNTFIEVGTTSVMRLDSIVEMDVDVIKLDVEGYEAAVLAGAEGLFSKHRVGFILMEVFESRIVTAGGDTTGMMRRLVGWGFKVSLQGFDGPWIDPAELASFKCPDTICNIFLRHESMD